MKLKHTVCFGHILLRNLKIRKFIVNFFSTFQIIQASFAGKDAKRACDYRQTVIDINKYIQSNSQMKDFRILFENLV